MDPDHIDESFVPTAHEATASVELDGEAVIYQEEAGSVHVLNFAATIIWGRLDGVRGISTLARDLASEFMVPEDQMLADVLEAVRELGRQGLLAGVVPDEAAVTSRTLPIIEHREPGQ